MKKAIRSCLSLILAITIIFSSAYVGLSEVDFNGIFAVRAKAASSGTCGDNLTWSLDDEGILTISGTGNMKHYDYSYSPWYDLRAKITNVIIDSGVTSIGNSIFSDCEHLVSITIPDSITSIGSYAFKDCTSLIGVYITDVVAWCDIDFGNAYANPLNNAKYLYLNNELVTDLVVPYGVTSINNFVFYHCKSLASIILPGSVTSIGFSSFADCTSLTSVTIPNSVKSIDDSAFNNCTNLIDVTIGNSLTSIGFYAFYNCTSLTSVTIPDSVTNLGSYAFENCTSLTDITIGKGLTDTGACVFKNCTSLTSIIIPDNITSIAPEVFSNCTSLTSIIIPDSITYISHYAFFGCTGLSVVNYLGNKKQWDEQIIIEEGNEVLFSANIYCNSNKYSLDVDRISLGNNSIQGIQFDLYNRKMFLNSENNSIVSSKTNAKINNATVKYNDTILNLDKNQFFLSYENLSTQININSSGYKEYIIPQAVVNSWKNNNLEICSIYMDEDYGDGKTYISSVFARNNGNADNEYIDITTENLNILNGIKTDIIITSVVQNSPVKEYWLSQDEAHKISDADGVFSAVDLYSIFDANKPVYAYAILQNGEITESIVVSIKKQVMSDTATKFLNACEESTVSFMGEDGFKITLSDNIPLIGGSNISTGLAMLPVGIEIQNERVRISIGIDIFKNEINGKSDTQWLNFKDSCKSISKSVSEAKEKMKTYNNLLLAREFGTVEMDPVKKKSFDGCFLGYIEAYIIDGDIVFKEVSGTIALEFFFNYKQQFLVYGIPALYAYVKAGAEASVQVTGGRPIPDKNMPIQFDVAASLTPTVKIGGGVGVKDAVSAGVWGKGSMPVGYNFTDTHFTLDLKGSIGLEAEFFILKGDVTLLDGSVNLIDKYFRSSGRSKLSQSFTSKDISLNSGDSIDIFKDGNVSLADRSYLENTSDWLGGQSVSTYNRGLTRSLTSQAVTVSDLQTSVYKNSQTQLVNFGNTMMMVWVEDCANRDAYNRMRLMYSVYDVMAGTWKAPQPVADNGFCDGSPSLASDGENVYVAWQNINTKISTDNAETVDIIMQNAEICIAKFNAATGSFEHVKTVTNNSTYDYAPKVTVNNGIAEVYWVNSSTLDFKSGTLSIQKSDFSGNVSRVLNGLNYVHSVDSNGTNVSYTMDRDGDTSTTTDVKVYTDGTQVSVDYENAESSCIAMTYAMLGGKKTLFYADDYNLYYYKDGAEQEVFEDARFINGNLQITSKGNETTAMWLEAGDVGTELYSCTYKDGEWSSPVQITSFSKVLSNVSITYFNNTLYGLFNQTHLEEVTNEVDGSTYYKNGTTDFCQFSTEGFTDIGLLLLDIDESQFVSGERVVFDVWVENKGTKKTTNISFEVTDGNGYSQTIEKNLDLKSGEMQLVKLSYTVPETILQTELSVYANVYGDTDYSDNIVSIEVGTPDLTIGDLKVKLVEDVYIVSGVVANNNNVVATDVWLNAYLGDTIDDNLFVKYIGKIEPKSKYKVEYMIDGSLINFDEKSFYDVTLNLSCGNEEKNTLNNQAITIITKQNTHIHSYGDWIISKEATCTEDGSKHKKCTDCGEILETAVILSNGHNFVDGFCSVCDAEIMFEYTVENNSVTITGYKGEDTTIKMPDEINGLLVTAIGTDAFRDCTEITSVVIPDTVTSIGGSAFRGCTNLTEIVLPDTITSIPGAMCFGCTKLESVVIPDGVVNIGGYSFSGCTSLKTVVIPDSATNIGGSVFANCKSLIIVCDKNSKANTYAVDNNISYILNTANTNIDLSSGLIYTDILGRDLESIISGSKNIICSTDKLITGTGVLVDIMKDGLVHSSFTLVVNGDTNGDSVCDVLDCAQVELASNSNTNLSGAYAMAADSNADDLIDIIDYQAIVNRALAS